MTPCIIESPFRGANKAEEQRNRAYLDKLIRHAVRLGFSPYASHKMLTDSLDDKHPDERMKGISAGLLMGTFILENHPDAKVFFGMDYGESEGMQRYARPHYKNTFPDRILNVKVGKL